MKALKKMLSPVWIPQCALCKKRFKKIYKKLYTAMHILTVPKI